MAKYTIGKVRPIYKGEYDKTFSYEIMDWVTYEGNSFQALRGSLGVSPQTGKYWVQTSTQGEQGERGEDGKQGVTFIPEIDELGTLSWTNDGGLDNPEPVNLVYSGIEDLIEQLNNKVDKDGNKVLSDVNFSSEYEEKLKSLENYNDENILEQLNNKQDTIIAGNNVTIEDNVISVDNVEADVTYTNEEPSVSEVGGITVGTTFDKASIQEILDMMLYPELFPSFTSPSLTFSCSPLIVEVGETVSLSFKSFFNRGTISPSYGTSGYRTGDIISYVYSGDGLPETVNTTEAFNYHTFDYVPTESTSKTWTCCVNYSEGEQPLSSKGNEYDSPYPSGTTLTETISVVSVWSMYATTEDITVMTKQELSTPSDTGYYQLTMVAEDDINKQAFELYSGISSVTGVQMLNTLSGYFEWIGGTKEESLLLFDKTNVSHNGATYYRYEHNGDKIGERTLRFFVN